MRARKVYFKAVYQINNVEVTLLGIMEYPDILGYKIPDKLKDKISKVKNAKLIEFKYLQFVSGYTTTPKLVKLDVITDGFISGLAYSKFITNVKSKINKFIDDIGRLIVV